MSHNRSGSSFLADQGKQRRPSRSKPRLPVFQRFAFSVGHVLNDTVLGAWVSYLLIFQTKVLGLSNRTAGFLWIVANTVDSVLCIAVGYICDNYKFPLLARCYGKRKSFHLLGTILVAGFFPLLMMPCFVCGEDSPEWIMGIYYGTIMIVLNIGWALSQVTHLALIPEIAKRPNEMVELHALRSGFTFLSGIFVYAVTWIVLRTDGSSENITYTPEQKLTTYVSLCSGAEEMAVIVVGASCVFSLIFHVGTHEPPQTMEVKNRGPSGSVIGRERQSSRTSTLPLSDKTVGVFCLYDENELTATSAKTEGTEVIQVEQADIAIETDVTCKDRSVDRLEKKDVELRLRGLDKGQNSNEFSFSNPAFQNDGRQDIVCEQTVSNLNEDSDTQPTSAVHTEQIRKENEFSFANPAFLREDKQTTEGYVPREKSQTGGDFQNDELMEERQSNRSGSSGSSEGYASSPETDSVDSIDCAYLGNKAQKENSEHRKQEICAAEQTRPGSVTKDQIRPGSVTKGSDTNFCGVSVIIEKMHQHETKNIKTIKTWTDWFKTPMFYKISFAFMCARLVQVLNSSYVPLYLTDTLGFEKESIAYFPLVILISGVFSSLCAKKLDKMLGDKWTYSLAAVLAAGSSVWFYLQTESGRNAVYCAAILVGCGGSVMYVTSMALAGKLIGENKESGAFVFASMAVLAKVACGTAIFISQEFFPHSGDCGEYVRYVFSVGPGAGSLLGFLAVIAFLPATVRCKKVVHTVDCSVQTEAMSAEVLYANDNPAAIDDEFKGNELVLDINSKPRVVS